MVISDRDVKFTLAFWKVLFKGLCTQVQFSNFYHGQTDGEVERVNWVIEDMLRMFVMQQPKKWDDYIYLVDFYYKIFYHDLLKMRPFEVLYGRKCKKPINWSGFEDKLMLGLEMLVEMEEEVRKVRFNLKVG